MGRFWFDFSDLRIKAPYMWELGPFAGHVDSNGNLIDGDGCEATCMSTCGDDCWGDSGCETAAGRCVRFTCTTPDDVHSACDSCFGWLPITHDQWLSDGYCPDVTDVYRSFHNNETRCGGPPLCCSSPAACAGNDNAWHLTDGVNTWLHGPCLGCGGNDCTYWNQIIGSSDYTRITACERL